MVKPGYVGPFRARATVVGGGGRRVGVEATMTDQGNGRPDHRHGQRLVQARSRPADPN